MNANQSEKTENDLQWDIDRYLLADPSLDRDDFERRMLEDSAIAEQVAASVADLQLMAGAAKQSSQHLTPQVTLAHTSPNRFAFAAMLATAAGLLIAISAWQFRSSSSDDQLAKLADNWAAIEGLSVADSVELVQPFESPRFDLLRGEDSIDTEANEQSDWLVEAAREFYLANNEGAAG